MRRSAQVFTAASLLCGSLAVVVAAAPMTHAADTVSAKPKVVQSNWFWYQQENGAPVTGIDLPEPSGVPDGDLAVAFTGGRGTADPDGPSKETFLAFDLTGVSKTASVSSFSFTLTLDTGLPLHTTQPELVACLPVRTWENGAGDPYTSAPVVDCAQSIAAPGTYDAAKSTYTFSVPAMAQRWVSDVNTGVAIRQAADNTAPFQLVFTGPSTVTSAFSYVPAEPTVTTTPPPVDGGDDSSTSTGGTGSGSVGTGGTGSLSGGSVDSGGPTTGASAAPGPQVAAPLTNVRKVGAAGALPPAGFWLVGALLLGTLALASLVLGDTNAPAPAGPAGGSRLERVLRSRRSTLNPGPMTQEF